MTKKVKAIIFGILMAICLFLGIIFGIGMFFQPTPVFSFLGVGGWVGYYLFGRLCNPEDIK